MPSTVSLAWPRSVAKEGAAHWRPRQRHCWICAHAAGRQANPETGAKLPISELPKTGDAEQTVDGEFTTMQDVAEAALFLGATP